MKLKKIASLALVGAMAVSMLAGCKGGNGAGNGTTGGSNDPTVTTSSIVDAVNKGQSAANTVKINFTVDSKLDSALKRAVETLGVKADTYDVETAVKNMTGYNSKNPANEWTTSDYDLTVDIQDDHFLNGNVVYNRDYTRKAGSGEANYGSEDGKVYTAFGVHKFHAVSEEFVLNLMADGVDNVIAELAESSNDADNDGNLDDTGAAAIEVDDKYYAYGYDGSISMVSIETENGTTDYYVAWIVNQTITEKKL